MNHPTPTALSPRSGSRAGDSDRKDRRTRSAVPSLRNRSGAEDIGNGSSDAGGGIVAPSMPTPPPVIVSSAAPGSVIRSPDRCAGTGDGEDRRSRRRIVPFRVRARAGEDQGWPTLLSCQIFR